MKTLIQFFEGLEIKINEMISNEFSQLNKELEKLGCVLNKDVWSLLIE
jgi:hypothetical protein